LAWRTFALAALSAWSLDGASQTTPTKSASAQATADLVAAMEKLGIHLAPDRGLCTLSVRIDIRDDLLEYVLVNPRGQAHESLFVSEVAPRALNAALLALGVQQGENVKVVRRDPPPTVDELRDGVAPYTLTPPSGDGLYLYCAWKSG